MTPAPAEITYRRQDRILVVAFDDGARFELPAELLRVESPSAEVQGHHPSQKQIVTGKSQVSITAIEPVGTYAVCLVFDDGHDSGIYTWDYLYKLGAEKDCIWTRYQAATAKPRCGHDHH